MKYQQAINKYIQLALEEDIKEGDHTSLSTIPSDANGKAQLIVKDEGVIAGIEVAEAIAAAVDPKLKMNILITDGTWVKYGDIAFTMEGPSQSIVTAERLILNCMQRMSGIATTTKEYVDLIKHTDCKLLDTRKTTPNFRAFQKEAVVIGGGHNHRFGLYDMIMIKDNHVDFAGGVVEAIDATQSYLAKNQLDLKVEIEIRTAAELDQALERGDIDRIMLDNHSPEEIKNALSKIDKRFETEASGGITKTTLVDYAETGVDFISVGALTHSSKSLDMSLKAC
jgi:nicotinate-nucleotide pyrophosphorylase (carboxylating)